LIENLIQTLLLTTTHLCSVPQCSNDSKFKQILHKPTFYFCNDELIAKIRLH